MCIRDRAITLIICLVFTSGYAIGLFIWAQSNVDFTMDPGQLENAMDSVVLSAMLEGCFKDGKDYISTDFLSRNDQKSICQVCGDRFPNMCRSRVYAVVTQLPENDEYTFGFPVEIKDPYNVIFVNVGDEKRTGVGRLVVKI